MCFDCACFSCELFTDIQRLAVVFLGFGRLAERTADISELVIAYQEIAYRPIFFEFSVYILARGEHILIYLFGTVNVAKLVYIVTEIPSCAQICNCTILVVYFKILSFSDLDQLFLPLDGFVVISCACLTVAVY